MIHFNAFYGLDVHQSSITIARITPNSSTPEVLSTLPNDQEVIEAFFKKQLEQFDVIQSCYEAGGCGYVIDRLLKRLGVHNIVIAPTQIPNKSSQRIKNDKVDACNLAKFLRLGQLSAVYVPTVEDEVIREKARQRESLQKQLHSARQQLLGFLRRHGLHYRDGKTRWTKRFWSWLSTLHFQQMGLQDIFLDYQEHIETLIIKRDKVAQELRHMKESWSSEPVVDGIRTLKGFDVLNTTTLVSEVGTFLRFPSAGEFMSYLGMIPSEYSSGKRVTRGRITKMGSGRLRRLLTEAALWYRKNPSKTKTLLERWKGQSQEVLDHAWKAQRRLHRLYWSLINRGKHHNLAITAVSRELAGFLWAIGTMVELEEHQKNQKVA